MPGFATHYIFGRDTYHKLPHGTLKACIAQYPSAYQLGLQGPDLFFYYLPSYVLHGKNPGTVAHECNTNDFFRALLKSCEQFSGKRSHAIALSYVAGFLGHYSLDTFCHPYVYAVTRYNSKDKSYFSRHAYLETEIDSILLSDRLHIKPSAFHAEKTIALSFREKHVISRLLCAAYRSTFPALHVNYITMRLSIFSTRLSLHLLRDRTGQKKVLVRFAEKLCLGYPLFSPLIASDSLFFRTDPCNLRHASWTNPWNVSLKSKKSFPELYREAMNAYLARLQKLENLPCCGDHSAPHTASVETLLADYGNRSFHSGLDWTYTLAHEP